MGKGMHSRRLPLRWPRLSESILDAYRLGPDGSQRGLAISVRAELWHTSFKLAYAQAAAAAHQAIERPDAWTEASIIYLGAGRERAHAAVVQGTDDMVRALESALGRAKARVPGTESALAAAPLLEGLSILANWAAFDPSGVPDELGRRLQKAAENMALSLGAEESSAPVDADTEGDTEDEGPSPSEQLRALLDCVGGWRRLLLNDDVSAGEELVRFYDSATPDEMASVDIWKYLPSLKLFAALDEVNRRGGSVPLDQLVTLPLTVQQRGGWWTKRASRA